MVRNVAEVSLVMYQGDTYFPNASCPTGLGPPAFATVSSDSGQSVLMICGAGGSGPRSRANTILVTALVGNVARTGVDPIVASAKSAGAGRPSLIESRIRSISGVTLSVVNTLAATTSGGGTPASAARANASRRLFR